MIDHFLRRWEIPLEHHLSLPLPTQRYGEPAFAFYACPIVREPPAAPRCRPPDRHWAFSANSGALLFYAQISVLPLAPPGESWSVVTLEASADTVTALVDQLNALAPIMDRASAAFFDGEGYPHGEQLAEEFVRTVGRSVLPFYRAMAPDFLGWLMGGASGGA
jgi:hypothetical protein